MIARTTSSEPPADGSSARTPAQGPTNAQIAAAPRRETTGWAKLVRNHRAISASEATPAQRSFVSRRSAKTSGERHLPTTARMPPKPTTRPGLARSPAFRSPQLRHRHGTSPIEPWKRPRSRLRFSCAGTAMAVVGKTWIRRSLKGGREGKTAKELEMSLELIANDHRRSGNHVGHLAHERGYPQGSPRRPREDRGSGSRPSRAGSGHGSRPSRARSGSGSGPWRAGSAPSRARSTS